MSAPAAKPQAASHMFWFFILPCLGFMVWASYQLLTGALHPVPKDVFTRLGEIRQARSPGDRWQSAYGLSQELQKMIRDHSLSQMPAANQDRLYSELRQLLAENATDARLKRYLLLTLGQMADARALPALEDSLSDKDPEVKFFSAWGYLDLLSKRPELSTPERVARVRAWTGDADPALRKISASFLVQRGPAERALVEKLLHDENVEVRWNAAVALATVGDSSAVPVLKDVFDLNSLRALDIGGRKDLEQLVATAAIAARKLGNAEVLAQMEKLRHEVNPQTPEGRAVLKGLSDKS